MYLHVNELWDSFAKELRS